MTKYCVLSTAGADNANANSNNIISAIKGRKLDVLVVTLSARDTQKLSKLLIKKFERSIYWNKFKKSENKNTTSESRHFHKSNFVEFNRLFVLVYTNQDANAQRFNAWKYYLLKVIIVSYNVIIDEKNVNHQAVDSDIKKYEEIRKLTTEQG